MNLKELFRRLSYGELSNIAVGDAASGGIRESDREKVVLHLNDALIALYTRFILSEKTLYLQILEGKTRYELVPWKSVTNSGCTCVCFPCECICCAYILDSCANPFTGDLVKVLSVHESSGYELPINDRTRLSSLFTPSSTVLEVPLDQCQDVLALTYQAYHPEVLFSGEEDYDTEIVIPIALERALTAYIGHKIYSNMNTQESLMKSQEQLLHYESICAEAEQQDLVSVSGAATCNKFEKFGWV